MDRVQRHFHRRRGILLPSVDFRKQKGRRNAGLSHWAESCLRFLRIAPMIDLGRTPVALSIWRHALPSSRIRCAVASTSSVATRFSRSGRNVIPLAKSRRITVVGLIPYRFASLCVDCPARYMSPSAFSCSSVNGMYWVMAAHRQLPCDRSSAASCYGRRDPRAVA